MEYTYIASNLVSIFSSAIQKFPGLSPAVDIKMKLSVTRQMKTEEPTIISTTPHTTLNVLRNGDTMN
jgi:hypothetical protein